MNELKQNLNTIKNRRPMNEQEMDQFLSRTEQAGKGGDNESYK